MSDIGLLNEKPLHASLKEWIAQPGDRFEVKVDRFVIDIVRDDVFIEIQTGSFASIKSKLKRLVESHRIHLVYPIAQEKWIVKTDPGGDGSTRRKSPKQGRVEDLFWEMVSIPELMQHPNFSLETLLIHEEELRKYDERRNWRRKGWGTEERRLVEVVACKMFSEPADWLALLPENLGDSFTASDLSTVLNIRRALAQRMAYCFRKANLIQLLGKRGRAYLYGIVAS